MRIRQVVLLSALVLTSCTTAEFTASVESPTGYTSSGPITLTVSPGGVFEAFFYCGGNDCKGVPQLASTSKGLLPAIRFKESSVETNEFTHMGAGAWKVFK